MTTPKKMTTQKKTDPSYAYIEKEIKELTDNCGECYEWEILRYLSFHVGAVDNRNTTQVKTDSDYKKKFVPTSVLFGEVVSIYQDENGPNMILDLDSGYKVYISRDLFAYVTKEWKR